MNTPRILHGSLVVAALAIGGLSGCAPRAFGDPGTSDFVEYWGAFHVAAAGGNPYDPSSLGAVERQVGRTDDLPLMMWNPPWLLVVMRPVLSRSFGTAANLWMSLNVCLIAVAAVLITLGYRQPRVASTDFVHAMLGAALSAPAVMTIQLGQVSLVLLVAVSLLYWGLCTRHDVTAGAALSLLSLKPHLFLSLVVLVAMVVIRERRWRIAAGAIGTLALLLGATVLYSTTLLPDWLQSVVRPPAGAPAPVAWRTPNLPNVLREVQAARGMTRSTWPLTVVPVLAAILVAYRLWRVPRDHPIASWLPPVLCVSVATAPFGWTFDHVVLAVPQVIVFLRALTEVDRAARRWLVLGAVLLSHLALVAQSQLTDTDYFEFWWFPPVMLGIWWLSTWAGRTGARQAAA